VNSIFETRRRSVAKALSWRTLAAVKLFVYFYHERVWNKISYGRVVAPDYEV
jgi:hypothetical protein